VNRVLWLLERSAGFCDGKVKRHLSGPKNDRVGPSYPQGPETGNTRFWREQGLEDRRLAEPGFGIGGVRSGRLSAPGSVEPVTSDEAVSCSSVTRAKGKNSTMPHQQLSKVEAATQQLRTAISLYFQDADSISVLTLAAAAHDVLRDILIHRDGPQSVLYVPEAKSPPEGLSLITKMVKEAQNFFKHANRDAKGVLTFNPDWTDFLLYEAIWMYIKVAGKVNREHAIFLMWITSKYPTVVILDEITEGRIAELRKVFPALSGSRKRPFLAALNEQ
jgi:hypothetical protein